MLNITDKLDLFVRLTEEMLELARQDDWQRLGDIESERRADLEVFLKSLDDNVRQQYAVELKRAINKILEVDKQIMALANNSKSKAADAVHKNHATRKAMSEYKNNAAF